MIPKNQREAETLWALEEDKRWKMRKQMFPDIRDDTVIFANWNQLYKVSHLFRSQTSPKLIHFEWLRSILSSSEFGSPSSNVSRTRFFGSYDSQLLEKLISRKRLVNGLEKISLVELYSPMSPTRTNIFIEVESLISSLILPRCVDCDSQN